VNTRTLILLFFIFNVGFSLPTSATTFIEDEYTLLELQYKRQTLGYGVESYLHDNTLYILLIDIVSALELNITFDSDKYLGHIENKNDTFNLEHINDEWKVTYNGKTETIDKESIVIKDDLVYVKDSLVEKWFGLDFQLFYAELTLSFTASKKLPIIERLRRQNRSIGSRQFIAPAENPELKTPYSLFEIPSVDLRSTSYIRDSEKSGTTNRSVYTLISHGDMGYMNTALFINGSPDDDIKNATIRMDRFDTTGEMAGPLHLSQVSIGDLQHPSIPFAPGSSGRGITIGNDATSRQTTRNTTVIEGDNYPGQEVELYANGSLIDYQIIPENGHYRFEDVILFVGDNLFLLKFYGINGTVETEDRKIRVGDTADGSSRLKYNLSVSQPDQRTIDIDGKNSERSTRLHSSFTSHYTFNRYLSGNLGYVYSENDIDDFSEGIDDSNNYYSVGLQTKLFGNYLSVSASSKEDELQGIIYRLGGYAFRTRYNLSTIVFNDLTEEDDDPLNPTNRLEQNYGLNINTKYELNSFTLKSTRNRYTFGYNERHRVGLSSRLWGTNLSSINTYKVADDGFSEHTETLDGGVFFSRRVHPLSVRLNLAYTVIPESELTTSSLSFTFNPSTKTTVNFGVTHNLLSNSTVYDLSGSWKSKFLQFTPKLRYDSDGNSSATLSLFTSLGKRTGRFGNYFNLDTKKRSDRGVLRARLFEDGNMNGTYDTGENLLSGGRIFAPQYRSKAKSNDGGIAWIEHTTPWQLTDIEYENNSLDAFSMKYNGKPFSVAIRPGKITEVDMPFIRTGDIDGTVYRKYDNGVSQPVRGAIVVALNSKGQEVAKSRTDLDGYFSFEGLVPNTYLITVKFENIISRSKGNVTITNAGEFIADYQIIVSPKESTTTKESKKQKPTKPIKKPEYKPKPKSAIPKKPITTKTFPLPKPSIVTKNIRETTKVKALPISTAKRFPDPKPVIKNTFSMVTPVKKAVKEPENKTPPIDDFLSYAIKVGSFSSRSYAVTSIKNMRKLGHSTFTEIVNTPKGIVTRVFVGPIIGKQKAEIVKETINAKHNQKAFVVPFES